MALATRGWQYGLNFLHLCFPMAEHDEKSWGMRLHLPMQFILGAVARASRLANPVLGAAPKKKVVKPKPAVKKVVRESPNGKSNGKSKALIQAQVKKKNVKANKKLNSI